MTSEASGTGIRARSRRRVWKIIIGVTAASIISWFVYATVNILNPAQGQLQTRSDAVVSLAPQIHRLPLAQQLIDGGVSDTLVISYFDHDPLNLTSDASTEGLPLQTYCESESSHTIFCFTPEENATIGEAYEIAAIAEEHSWNSLTVVTDTSHVFRVRFIFEQCLGEGLDVNVVFTTRDLTVSEWAWHAAYENAAFFKAAWQTVQRC